MAAKTPSLGLVWSTQVACRVALVKKPAEWVAEEEGEGGGEHDEREEGGGRGHTITAGGLQDPPRLPAPRKTWRRWMKVVFASHAPPSGDGLQGAVEFDITPAGVVALGTRPSCRRNV